ncbi:hypothetical protein BO83DRAFT_445959 [Aspergillus eucalypticola CBS 122712]|uniref:Uncharacterized protein n=1 Tax=Aspergillus eucalypticola (strain CBS 122712 / IBT 29274) TaxID=1448314 RepID=A0A317VEF9_ASPEC|nr:uncharacterized protein BO83DRAFT_445959 [Aspergillus eucalypticola CBS 122712]PWY72763.1 hypothetical protein BO83DRAFT_445959 [Aspergillus eucalypticola CBS 122712]
MMIYLTCYPDFGHAEFPSNDVNQDLLFLSQLAAFSTPELVNPSYPPNPNPAVPRLSSSTSRAGIPGISQLASSPSIANLHIPSCTCLQSTLTLYESIRAVQWRAQCVASAGLWREMAHPILKACKLALNQCHQLIGCSSCKREPLFVMFLCSVCEQCLTCFETFYDSHQRRLRSRSMTSSSLEAVSSMHPRRARKWISLGRLCNWPICRLAMCRYCWMMRMIST